MLHVDYEQNEPVILGTPEAALWAAVLHRAVLDLKSQDTVERGRAAAYLSSDDPRVGGSAWICDVLEIRHEVVRALRGMPPPKVFDNTADQAMWMLSLLGPEFTQSDARQAVGDSTDKPIRALLSYALQTGQVKKYRPHGVSRVRFVKLDGG